MYSYLYAEPDPPIEVMAITNFTNGFRITVSWQVSRSNNVENYDINCTVHCISN